MADEEEYVQLSINEVFVYKIPPRTTAAGHKASDWKEQVWVGKLQVVTKENGCAIKLIGENGKVFAVAPVRRDGPPAAEKVTDSSRYFTLRIENDKAFDFNVAIADWLKQADLDSGVTNALDKLDLGPQQDFSLKEGQKFSIKVAGVNAGTAAAKKPVASSGATGSIGRLRAPGALAPPAVAGGAVPASSAPGSGSSISSAKQKVEPALSAFGGGGGAEDDPFGFGTSAAPATGGGASARPAAKPAAADDWATF